MDNRGSQIRYHTKIIVFKNTTSLLFLIISAMEYGYKLCEVCEIWHFPERSTELFKDYLKVWIEIKLKSTPLKGNSDEEKLEEIRQMNEQFGLSLTLDQFIPNEPLAFIAKIILNSFW